MKDEKKGLIKHIINLLKALFFYGIGLMVVTYIMADHTPGTILGFIIHLFFKLAVVSMLICITNKKKLPFVLYNITEYLFGVINYLKVSSRMQTFAPWDISFATNIDEIVSYLKLDLQDIEIILLGLFFAVTVTIIDVYAIENYADVPSKKGKVAIFLISIPLLIFLCTSYLKINMKYIESEKNGYANYTRFKSTGEYGAFVDFFLEFGLIDLDDFDQDYSEKKISEICNKYNSSGFGDIEYDNVIVVLLESYYDLTQFEKFKFEKDPLKNYHEFVGENGESKVLVDSIGGGTANAEYQVLTMHSVDQYYSGIYPYMQLIDKDMETLPSLLKRNGFEITAIHNYDKNFYNRGEAYQYMGIDNFIDVETMNEDEYYGDFIADEEVFNRIVETIEYQDKSFITATTMGTHAPYYGFYFDEYEEWIDNDDWGIIEKPSINNYIQKLRKLDEMLGKLISYVKESDEKTLLIAYGDHFPIIYDLAEYEGIIDESEKNITREKYSILFEMPCIIYSNVEKLEVKQEHSLSELGMYILENVKLDEISPVYKVIYDYFKGFVNKETYELIQYDNVQGNQYWKKIKAH